MFDAAIILSPLAGLSHLNGFFDALGILGASNYILNYGLTQSGHLKPRTVPFCLMNGSAASLVLISVLHDFNIAAFLIQVAWIVITIWSLLALTRRDRPHTGMTVPTDRMNPSRTCPSLAQETPRPMAVQIASAFIVHPKFNPRANMVELSHV